jgi:hypothetical protein
MDEGFKAIENGIKKSGVKSPSILGILVCVNGIAGRTSEARKYFRQFEKYAQKEYTPASAYALSYIGLGEIEKSFDWFEKSIDNGELFIMEFWDSKVVDPLRSHPRYKALLKKMNLES